MKKRNLIYFVLVLFASACGNSNEEEAILDSGKDGWLKGTNNEKFDVVAAQLRGFDMAMVETGYRYQELYWAGKDQNWEYAQYQTEKIRKAISNGLERRPKRSASAQSFLDESLPAMEEAIASADSLEFTEGFKLFTNACNNCHAKENVPFFSVKEPLTRQSPIRK